jgi:hypothetical protein
MHCFFKLKRRLTDLNTTKKRPNSNNIKTKVSKFRGVNNVNKKRNKAQ